jgi:transcription elongation factor GreB
VAAEEPHGQGDDQADAQSGQDWPAPSGTVYQRSVTSAGIGRVWYARPVSKAFLRDDEPPPDDAHALPPRADRLPITPAGHARFQRELAALVRRPGGAASRRARVLTQVLESVYVVEPSIDDGKAAFGTLVTVEDGDGRRSAYELVGPDEADLVAGRISIASPVARALLGKRAGDAAILPRPRGAVEVTVVSVTIGRAPADP